MAFPASLGVPASLAQAKDCVVTVAVAYAVTDVAFCGFINCVVADSTAVKEVKSWLHGLN
jgi:hypothetical protein